MPVGGCYATPVRKARIVCTLGPATSTAAAIQAMIEAGMDVARLNFSHGAHEDHQKRLSLVRAAAERAGRPVAILQDLQGPKIRVGRLKGGKVVLKEGSIVTITTRDTLGSAGLIPTTYAGLPGDVRKGEAVLLNDGRLRLTVLSVGREDVKCRVEVGGLLSDHKGINLPESDVSTSSLTEKDVQDALFGRDLNVDYMALSFVRSAEDVLALRKVVGPSLPLIAKIEKPQAVDRISEIAAVAEGVMVARGDLGVELPLERVPLVQKTCIERATHEGKLAIVATEMLESMIDSPRPTRAEVSDVANAILDGADAVMLSGETATGKFPIEAVRTMGAIITEVEHSPRFRARPPPPALDRNDSFPTAVARASVAAAEQLGISTIVCCTETGRSARLLSEHRPAARVVSLLDLSLAAPQSGQMQQAIAHELLRVRDLPGAIAAFRRAAAIDTHLPGIHFELAEALQASPVVAEHAEAEGEYRLALTLEPGNAGVQVKLADLLSDGGDWQQARRLYESALSSNPANQSATVGLARADSETGNDTEAAKTVGRSGRRRPLGPAGALPPERGLSQAAPSGRRTA